MKRATKQLIKHIDNIQDFAAMARVQVVVGDYKAARRLLRAANGQKRAAEILLKALVPHQRF